MPRVGYLGSMWILVAQRFRQKEHPSFQNLLVAVSDAKSSIGESCTSKEGSDTLASSSQPHPTQRKPENGSVYSEWGRIRNFW